MGYKNGIHYKKARPLSKPGPNVHRSASNNPSEASDSFIWVVLNRPIFQYVMLVRTLG